MQETFRATDMKAEREVARFLDEHLYTRNIFSKAERTDDAALQMNGSDIIVTIPSKGIEDAVVDEKASIYYINKNIPTFVLELSFLNKNGFEQEGWFLNNDLSTDYYLLQWINADINKPYDVTAESITQIECVLVKKQILKAYFRIMGYDERKLRDVAKGIRENGIVPQTNTPDFRFHYTESLAEKPINIVLKKNVYISLATEYFVVKRA